MARSRPRTSASLLPPRGIVGLLAVLLVTGCGGGADGESEADVANAGTREAPAAGTGTADRAPVPLLDPSRPEVSRRAPDRYRVHLTTSAGDFVVEVERALTPRGADRFYNLVRAGFYDGARFFRVIEGFVAQFGLAAEPRVSLAWRSARLRDDPARRSNERGTVTFAHAGPDSRTTQVFVNLGDNSRLDTMGFAPFGRVVEGMETVDRLHDGYGDTPSQGEILRRGEAYLAENFPELDVIEDARIVGSDSAPDDGGAPPAGGDVDR